jgi:hypothetical protein
MTLKLQNIGHLTMNDGQFCLWVFLSPVLSRRRNTVFFSKFSKLIYIFYHWSKVERHTPQEDMLSSETSRESVLWNLQLPLKRVVEEKMAKSSWKHMATNSGIQCIDHYYPLKPKNEKKLSKTKCKFNFLQYL